MSEKPYAGFGKSVALASTNFYGGQHPRVREILALMMLVQMRKRRTEGF